MKILVIGNGFDKQHGLKTSYHDFIDFCKSIVSASKNDSQCETSDMLVYNSFIKQYPSLATEFVSILDNLWIEHFIKTRNCLGDKWINFESEIEQVVKELLSEKNAAKNEEVISRDLLSNRTILLHSEMSHTCRSYTELFSALVDDLIELNRALEIYLYTHAELDNKACAMKFFSDLHPDRLVSFNYTHTYQRLYESDIKTDYIHGEVDCVRNKNENDIVLGFDDHYFEGSDTIPELVPFEKYYQRIVKCTGRDYYNWLEEKDANGNPVQVETYFYGHSMSPADGDVLRSLIMHPNVRSTILYRKDFEIDRAEMIKNLAIVLSPQELIKRTGGREPSIAFVPIDFEE